MREGLRRYSSALICGALLVAAGSGFGIHAQAPAVVARKPLTYDTYDAWRSIQGTTLSRDGEWLAYALTAQGVDGELVVRNLKTGVQNASIRRWISSKIVKGTRFPNGLGRLGTQVTVAGGITRHRL